MDNLEEEVNNSDIVDDNTIINEEVLKKENKILAILSYLGILALIPYYTVKDSSFVKYHAIQGMNLLIVWISYYLLYSILSQIKVNTSCLYGWLTCKVTPWWVTLPLTILGILIGIISIFGIYNVIKEKMVELPFVNKIKVFK